MASIVPTMPVAITPSSVAMMGLLTTSVAVMAEYVMSSNSL